MKFFKKTIIKKILIKNTFLKKPLIQNNVFKKTNLNLFDLLVKFIFKNGLKKSSKINLLKAFNYFFLPFRTNNIIWEGLTNQINILKQSFFKDINFFNVNFILYWLTNFLNPIFDINCHAVPKKYKKKLKKNYFFKLKYNYFSSRKKISFKWLHLYSNNFNDRSLTKRLLKSLFFTFVNGKNSYLYKKKIYIYSKFLQQN